MTRVAASTAAFAIKLLTLLRSAAAARSMTFLSSSVRYTSVLRPNGSRDRRRDFGEARPFMASILHRRETATNTALDSYLDLPRQTAIHQMAYQCEHTGSSY